MQHEDAKRRIARMFLGRLEGPVRAPEKNLWIVRNAMPLAVPIDAVEHQAQMIVDLPVHAKSDVALAATGNIAVVQILMAAARNQPPSAIVPIDVNALECTVMATSSLASDEPAAGQVPAIEVQTRLSGDPTQFALIQCPL